MKITIAERLRPFSHTPGTGCLIPGTWWTLTAFPTLLRLAHGSKKIEIAFKLTGPVAEFTLQLDLERGFISIFGHAKEGYFRFRLEASDSGFDLYAEKTPSSGIQSSHGHLQAKDRLHLPVELKFILPSPCERLSLGSHKAQDWDFVSRRCDLTEILPPLLLLSAKIPLVAPQPLKMGLPEQKPNKTEIESCLQSLIKAGFKQMLVPRISDDQYQGISLIEAQPSAEPCYLLQELSRWVRSLFFRQNERRLEILPYLAPSFDAGRLIGIECPGIGSLDFEWTKFLLRKAVLTAETSGEILFDLQREIESFRVRTSRWEKGREQKAKEPLLLEKGKTYFLDHFQK